MSLTVESKLTVERLADLLDDKDIAKLVELKRLESAYGDPDSIRSHIAGGNLREAIIEISRFNDAFRDLHWLYEKEHGDGN